MVFEQVMTDTALYADVVLPATTFLEGYDFAKAYGPIALQLGRPVIDVVGEARSNADVFGELCARLGLLEDDEPSGELDLMLRVLDELPGRIGSDLRSGHQAKPPCGLTPVQFVDVFPNTPDRKVRLFSAELDASAPMGLYRFQPDPATGQFPLALISPASERTISSTLGELPRSDATLLMHPEDAQARGLADGDMVRVFNELGRRALPAEGVGLGPAWRGQPAEGAVAAQHAQQHHGNRAGARHPHRHRRGRLLQRRTRAGGVAGDCVA